MVYEGEENGFPWFRLLLLGYLVNCVFLTYPVLHFHPYALAFIRRLHVGVLNLHRINSLLKICSWSLNADAVAD